MEFSGLVCLARGSNKAIKMDDIELRLVLSVSILLRSVKWVFVSTGWKSRRVPQLCGFPDVFKHFPVNRRRFSKKNPLYKMIDL